MQPNFGQVIIQTTYYPPHTRPSLWRQILTQTTFYPIKSLDYLLPKATRESFEAPPLFSQESQVKSLENFDFKATVLSSFIVLS